MSYGPKYAFTVRNNSINSTGVIQDFFLLVFKFHFQTNVCLVFSAARISAEIQKITVLICISALIFFLRTYDRLIFTPVTFVQPDSLRWRQNAGITSIIFQTLCKLVYRGN